MSASLDVAAILSSIGALGAVATATAERFRSRKAGSFPQETASRDSRITLRIGGDVVELIGSNDKDARRILDTWLESRRPNKPEHRLAPTEYLPDQQAIPESRTQPNRVGEIGRTGADRLVLPDEELDALLSIIRRAAPSPVHPAVRAESAHAVMELLATRSDSDRFGLTVRVVPAGSHMVPEMMSLGLTVRDVYFLAVMAADGSATFRDVPAGEWNLRRLRGRSIRREDGLSVALPPPRAPSNLAAADKASSTAILRAILPDGGTELILHRSSTRYSLEVILPESNAAPVVVTVRYGTTDGGEQALLIPVLRTGLARLPGYDPGAPWQASAPEPPGQIRMWQAKTIAASVRAAGNTVTTRAWRQISGVTPVTRRLIDEELARSS